MISGAKRGKNERKGLHSWHPYYAGYSESFVKSVLHVEKLECGSTVLDPWIGSGTTGIVCQKLGINCIGIDINPVMSYFAAAKSKSIITELQFDCREYLNKILDAFTHYSKYENSDISLFQQSKKYYDIICGIFSNEKDAEYINAIKAFFCSVLFVTIRKNFTIKTGSNPTWISKKSVSKSVQLDFVIEYKNNYEKMIHELKDNYSDNYGMSSYKVFNADSKMLPISNSSVDLIITSPPYLTRIDYAVSTRIELEVISGIDGYDLVRKQTMGTTTVPSIQDDISPLWGDICLDVLSRVSKHYSIASNSYYLKNKIRYFHDAYESLLEIYRVLSNGKSAYLVIQNSYYKEIEIPLYSIYCEMAKGIGFSKQEIVYEENVKVILGQINSRSSIYIKDKKYFEKVIKVTK
ncbi:hypothetical protein NVI2019_PEGOAJLN_02742 [Providencia alcalifaciens]|uniref:DNA methyltransferase n=1 Tax=Providencia alcalifaciens TaxID=126385 RepID=UPI00044D8CFD|nr:DNA methyltransferase [Providencia alcalifaciens]EUD03070.1 methyltransferase domain protein [Providencia alcalifaciens RIMD 1656011]CAG9427345.1 hypothetical protein NVI2019_PEGOAJLN_02742 [Providencia alcalifaciens]